MTETSEFSTNDRYLIREYHKRGTNDYYLTDIGDKTFVVPCYYIAKAKNGVEAIRLFKADLLDFQNEELKKYQAATIKPRKIKVEGNEFIVPYKAPKDFNPQEIVATIVAKAEVKYNTIINAHRMLHEINFCEFSTPILNKYSRKLALQNQSILLAPEAIKNVEIYQSICKLAKEQGRKSSQYIKKSAQKLRERILKSEFRALKIYKPRYWKLALLGGMLSVSGYHLYHSYNEYEKQTKESQSGLIIKDTIPSFTDFMGRIYTDTLGNLRRLRELQPQIMTVLLSIEGFSENAFLDGRGNPTIGSGFTMIINEDGSDTKVKLGDKTTIQKDMIQNTYYIEREFSEILGDNIEKTLTPKEDYACIGAGYCWGTKNFLESSFFASLKNNEPISEQCRKLSGFRTPKGLLKREFVLAQLLSDNWTVEELLDLPIYYIKDKGYVHCGIYTLDFHDCVPCKKDKKGHYLKDAKGYDIPIIEKDGFCKEFYHPSFDEILRKIHNNPANRGVKYKTVRQLLNKELLVKLNTKPQNNIELNAFSQAKLTKHH